MFNWTTQDDDDREAKGKRATCGVSFLCPIERNIAI